jgi:D-galactarolactone cycloisomerase
MSAIERLEVFSLVYRFSPARGPSIAYGDTHAYAVVKLTDGDGAAGWGETYLLPGITAVIEDVAPVLMGRDAADAVPLARAFAKGAEHPYAASAVAIALDDLRARQRNLPIHALYGGARRERVRAYAAIEGYVEGVDPEQTWPAETEQLAASGYTAIKLRIGRYPLERERPIYEQVRRTLPASVDLCADGNGGYTLRRAIETSRVLRDLGFLWFEEPMHQWDGYVGYDVLNRSTDIALAGGEITMSRTAAREFVDNRKADIFQPEPVICGGIGETLFMAGLARLNAMATVPHTSGGAIGIAAALQAIAALPDPTRLPLHDLPMLETGSDPNPWRSELFTTPLRHRNGWVDVPTGPGLGFEVDEAFVRRRATEVRVVMAKA